MYKEEKIDTYVQLYPADSQDDKINIQRPIV